MFTYSTVTAVSNAGRKDQLKVKYDDDNDKLWSHYSHLKSADDMSEPDNVIDLIVMLASEAQPSVTPTKIEGKKADVLPRNYLECLVLPDWRDWVMAVHKEMSGWRDNHAYEEVDVADLTGDEKIHDLALLVQEIGEG